MSYSVPGITGPATCVLAVRASDALVLTRNFSVAGPALALSGAAISASAFYPTVVDGYRDSVTASWTSNKTAGHLVEVLDSNGLVVRREDLGDCRRSAPMGLERAQHSGGRVGVGTYRIRVDADDHAGSTSTFTRSVLLRSGYVVRRHSLYRGGSSSVTSVSRGCYATRHSRQGTTSLDCWGGRYARASYTFRLPAAAYSVRYALSGQRSAGDTAASAGSAVPVAGSRRPPSG